MGDFDIPSVDLTFTLHSAPSADSPSHHGAAQDHECRELARQKNSTARCDAVVTVLTYSDDSQCVTTGDAWPIAVLIELGIKNEPDSNCE